ncbi:hypothetical protein [Dactylosporangium salmoneum]|uniref:hypothetical protein n=1 Tax=Dactylosporangium salmoneum TaxID=53361 RepID=UPI0031DBADFB
MDALGMNGRPVASGEMLARVPRAGRARPAAAAGYAQRALSFARTVGDRMQEAWALQYAAIAHSHLDDPAAAMVAADTAADMFEQAGDIDAGCQTWTVRGHIARRLGDPVEAPANYRRVPVEDPASGMNPAIAES